MRSISAFNPVIDNKRGNVYVAPILRVQFPALQIDIVDFGGVNAALFNPTEGAYTGVVDGRRSGLAKGPRVVAASN
ncbi:MAG: hypothetical protein QNL88_00625 [Acidobacteriota bacterium]|nr:hypothetical protein [Acidobacteriota bacterium]